MDEPLRLAVLADDPLARAGLASMLAAMPGFVIAGQYGSNVLADFAAGVFDYPVDLIIWDTGWDRDTASFEEQVDAETPVLALVSDSDTALDVWRSGYRAILPRHADEGSLAAGILAAAAGLVVIAPAFTTILTADSGRSDSPSSDLTTRETEVLLLLAEGLTNKAIAQRLLISDHTVKFHVNAILSKLDAQSRTDAVVRATRLGLIAL